MSRIAILVLVALLVAVAVALPTSQSSASQSQGLQRIIRAATPEDLVRFKRGFRRGYGGYKRGHGGYGGCGRCGGGGYGGGYGGGSFANSGASAGSINTPFGGGSYANSYANAGHSTGMSERRSITSTGGDRSGVGVGVGAEHAPSISIREGATLMKSVSLFLTSGRKASVNSKRQNCAASGKGESPRKRRRRRMPESGGARNSAYIVKSGVR